MTQTYGEQLLAPLPDFGSNPYLSDAPRIQSGLVDLIDNVHALQSELMCNEATKKLCVNVINDILVLDEKVKVIYSRFRDLYCNVTTLPGTKYICLIGSGWHDKGNVYTIDKIDEDNKVHFQDGSRINQDAFIALVRREDYNVTN